MQPSPTAKRVLFVCTGNAGRSQIAQVLFHTLAGPAAAVFSAGVAPWPDLHPIARRLLEERGFDTAALHPKPVLDFVDAGIDCVITIGGRAQAETPPLPTLASVSGRPETVQKIASPARRATLSSKNNALKTAPGALRVPRRKATLMGYLTDGECKQRLARVVDILATKNLDLALVYYDEFNIGNGWYLTGWCPQFESGAVLVTRKGDALILGGPESEPFAKLDSTIKETRNFPVFMVPDEEYPNAEIIDFPRLFAELNAKLGSVSRIGLVGAERMPAECYRQIAAGFAGVELVDITADYLRLRYLKSSWEREQIRAAFKLGDACYDAMKNTIAAGASEIQVAAAGEYAARSRGASGFGFTAIVGSGTRSNAVVPTASSKRLEAGELVMVGLAPKVNGYAGVIGDVLPVSGVYTPRQQECLRYLREAFVLTRAQLVPGRVGREIDAPARAYFTKHGLTHYLVCPFVHTIGLHEAETPFFGPNSDDVLEPGMTVCVDVSFFGHPEFHGVRIETGYEITADGAVPLSPKLDALHGNP